MKLPSVFTVFCVIFFPSWVLAADPIQPKGMYARITTNDPLTPEKVTPLLSVFGNVGQFREMEVSEERNPNVRPNFVFASGDGYIVDQHIAKDALTEFDKKAAEFIGKLPTNSDQCYVQSFVLEPENRWVLLAVHNTDAEIPEHLFQCFTAGLHKFVRGTLDGFEPEFWRETYVELLVESQTQFSNRHDQ